MPLDISDNTVLLNKKKKNIVINMNSRYFPYSLVMLQSLFDNHPLFTFCVYLLYSDVKQWELDYLYRFIENTCGKFVPVKIDKNMFREFPLESRWSIETYYRLLIAEFLPENVTNVLYLDIDIAIDGDISGLYEHNLENYYLAACEDYYENIDCIQLNRKWGRAENTKYFNAGVMLLHLAKIREKVKFSDYIFVLRELNGELPYMDQDILNYLLGEKVLYLPKEFNNVVGVQTGKERKGLIYHYGTPQKPWEREKDIAFKDIWWKYADRVVDYKSLVRENVKES